MSAEAHLSFECFGGRAAVHVCSGDEEEDRRSAERVRELLLDAHRRLSRFDPESELSRFNRDPRAEVPASPLLRRLAAAVLTAGFESGGLVDATMLAKIERAGYGESRDFGETPPPSPTQLAIAERAPGRPDPSAEWCSISVDERAGTVIRPPGVAIDGGGIAKGLLADIAGETLAATGSYAVDCSGDIRFGGDPKARPRKIRVADPFGAEPVHELTLSEGAVATSGISRRAWIGPDGQPAHQILDPHSGRSAFSGLVQVTAVAPTALLAEVRAKSALLAGPEGAAEWLPHGGVVVADGGEVDVVPARERLMRATETA